MAVKWLSVSCFISFQGTVMVCTPMSTALRTCSTVRTLLNMILVS
jgi:hypothetical protein